MLKSLFGRSSAKLVKLEVESGRGPVSVAVHVPSKFEQLITPCIVLNHSSGLGMDQPFLQTAAQRFCVNNMFLVVRFNYPYMQQGRSMPDRIPVCLDALKAVVAAVRQRYTPGPLFLAGRSMGCRVAAALSVDTSARVMGNVMFAYPLHPAKQTHKLRTEDLLATSTPTLFVSGDRDQLCDLALLNNTIQAMQTKVDLEVLPMTDHSFKAPKKSGFINADAVTAHALSAAEVWIDRILHPEKTVDMDTVKTLPVASTASAGLPPPPSVLQARQSRKRAREVDSDLEAIAQSEINGVPIGLKRAKALQDARDAEETAVVRAEQRASRRESRRLLIDPVMRNRVRRSARLRKSSVGSKKKR